MDTLRLGRQVAAARRESGLTQVVLAAKAGTTQPVISRLEAGRVVPDLALLDRLARAMERPLFLVLGAVEPVTEDERRSRIERFIGTEVFDPWKRRPTRAEAEGLRADGIQPRA
ncbi:MAG: helix-turn-helix transcriptional regulator [Actinomycetota bacterium]